MSNPCNSHFEAACHLLKYLKGSPGQGLFFSKDSTLQLKAFCDSGRHAKALVDQLQDSVYFLDLL